MRSGRQLRPDVAGNGEDVAAVVLTPFDRRHRPASFAAGLHEDRPERQSGDDPVARLEVVLARAGSRRKLGDHGARIDDAPVQRTVHHRIRSIDSGSKHRDRLASRAQRTLVRGGIDAARHPAHDADPERRELGGELLCNVEPVRGRSPRADDRNRRPKRAEPLPDHPQLLDRRIDGREHGRELVVTGYEAVCRSFAHVAECDTR